jgi:protease I
LNWVKNDDDLIWKGGYQMHQESIKGIRVAILVSDDFEQSELTSPKEALEKAGANVTVISSMHQEIHGMNHDKLADTFKADITLDQAYPDHFDALMLPGGALNADQLRLNKKAQEFVRSFDTQKKPIAFICHAPWTLVSANLVKNRTLTSWPTIQDDIRNAGGNWVDQEVVRDQNWVSSRGPKDLPAFNDSMLRLFEELAVIAKQPAGV